MPRSGARSPARALALAAACVALSMLQLSIAACGDKSASITPPPDTLKPPTPPKSFDLRFKGVGILADSQDLAHENFFVSQGSALRLGADSLAGTPLELGGANVCSTAECDWFFDTFALPPGVARVGVTYSGSILANLPAALDTTLVGDTVITSLDIRPATGVFGFARAFTSQNGGYRLSSHRVPISELASAVASDGAARRVVTAVSFDSGQARYVAYSWLHDSAAAGYDTRVVETTQANVPTEIVGLAAAGFVATAVGGNGTDGFIVVGTRAHGDTRTHAVLRDPPRGQPIPGYAVVADLVDDTGHVTFVFEN